MLTDRGPRVLEYNVRLGDPETQAVLPRLESDAFELFLSVARGRLDEASVRFTERSALVVVLTASGYPSAPRSGDRIFGLEKARQQADARDVGDGRNGKDVRIYHAGTRRVGETLVSSGGRVLGVTGLGDDLEAAAARAYEAVREISFEGMFFRRDIGARAFGRRRPAPGET